MPDANNNPPSWRHLSGLQIGKYGEYYAKMEVVRLGYDVYTAEVDDKGIDFVLRRVGTRYLDVQVKAIRWPGTKYVFMQKTKIEVRENFLVVLVQRERFWAGLLIEVVGPLDVGEPRPLTETGAAARSVAGELDPFVPRWLR